MTVTSGIGPVLFYTSIIPHPIKPPPNMAVHTAFQWLDPLGKDMITNSYSIKKATHPQWGMVPLVIVAMKY